MPDEKDDQEDMVVGPLDGDIKPNVERNGQPPPLDGVPPQEPLTQSDADPRVHPKVTPIGSTPQKQPDNADITSGEKLPPAIKLDKPEAVRDMGRGGSTDRGFVNGQSSQGSATTDATVDKLAQIDRNIQELKNSGKEILEILREGIQILG